MRRTASIGWFGEDIAEFVADVATSAIDAISDAGGTIASVLKAVAPFAGLVPGIGTAFAVAMSAAAALAVGDPIDRAAIDLVSAAIPGGAPRIVFDNGAELTRAALRGEPMGPALLTSMRATAQAFGGDRAVEAFDAGVAYARTGRLDASALQAVRGQIAQGGAAALSAFDSSYAVVSGGGVDDAAIAIARDYVATAGGPAALAVFDTSVALAQGQALQDAGFAALQNFVKGNDAAERALRFGQAMAKAAREGKPLGQVLVDELSQDIAVLGPVAFAQIGPIVDRIKADSSLLQAGSEALAFAMGVAEPVARAAQAIMRSGQEDTALRDQIRADVEKQRAAVAAGLISAAIAARPTTAQAVAVPLLSYLATDRAATAAKELAAATVARTTTAVAVQASLTSIFAKPPTVVPAPTIVKSTAPALVQAASTPTVTAKPKPSTLEDMAIGGTIAIAGLVILWWARA